MSASIQNKLFIGAFGIIAYFMVTIGAEEEYQRVARDLHNLYRSRHHVDSLNASDLLNSRATQCAQYYATRGAIDHSCPYKNDAGENLWASWGRTSISDEDVARNTTDMWYAEESLHNYNADWQPPSGHFSQLVWKNSREIGFGTGRSNNMIVGCALYSPQGNVVGQFRDNVIPQDGSSAPAPSTPTTVLQTISNSINRLNIAGLQIL